MHTETTTAAPLGRGVLTIAGYEHDCLCEHCGRPLKLGVKTLEKGTIGADCFVRLIDRDRARFSARGKPSAETVREYAVIAARGSEALRLRGMTPRALTFKAKAVI